MECRHLLACCLIFLAGAGRLIEKKKKRERRRRNLIFKPLPQAQIAFKPSPFLGIQFLDALRDIKAARSRVGSRPRSRTAVAVGNNRNLARNGWFKFCSCTTNLLYAAVGVVEADAAAVCPVLIPFGRFCAIRSSRHHRPLFF